MLRYRRADFTAKVKLAAHYLKEKAWVETLDCRLATVPLAQMDLPIPSTAQKLHQCDVPWVNDLHGAGNTLQCELFRAVRRLIWYRASRTYKATIVLGT